MGKKSDILNKAKRNLENKKSGKDKRINSESMWNKWYIRVMMLCFVLFIYTCILIGNLFKLQILKGDMYSALGEKQYSSENYIKPKRGKISTDDGQLLAYDDEQYVVILDPSIIKEENIDKLLDMLKMYIEPLDVEKARDSYEIKKKYNKKYLKLDYKIQEDAKHAIEQEVDAATKQVKENNKGKDKSQKKTNPFLGIAFETVYTRRYENISAFQETVGFVNNENDGIYGVEKYYDKELAGEMGVVKGSLKIPEPFLKFSNIKNKGESKPAKDGNNIVLTIDNKIQDMLDRELNRTFNEYDATSTMGILLEVETGKVLAMSSYPKSSDYSKVKNRTITDFFEPGSIFKPITVSMGLQSKKISADTRFQLNGSIQVQDRVVRDHDDTALGNLSLADVIAHSSNVAMVKISQKLDRATFYKYLASVGLGSKTGIDTSAEMTKKLLSLKDLTEVRKANVAFGQGIAMTQIQMLMALNTVINNGKLMKPYIVDRIEDENGNIVKKNNPIVLRKVFSDEVSRLNRSYMEAVVSRGTGKDAQIQGYRVGGKTGTAQKSGKGGYQKGRYFSSFFAFFPVDRPKYALLITINEPKGKNYYGALVALPSVKKVLTELINYKRIGPDGETKVEPSVKETVIEENKKDLNEIKTMFSKNVMPDLKGVVLRDFYSIYPQGKYPNFKVSGSGKVVDQYPKAGEKIDSKTNIKIYFQ
ncbi:PASTA domain-containing protein [Leptotrichia sp. oral taxon 218]|jgi:peptidoglycan glycosyltransferase|uniref:penicillin-binding transpeptidase domain-containing protein n=1 Tax=Leptotrichia sp. oral taxon 218 TaxID=712361 RepID=UPI001B8A94BA|nr:penicillin-binding transpeptidase domain-containing protein [Leptotrichia sp. oral taxon 218]QUB95365.1 PASTA domain-containing protein [Leptotrichia sp. oral taxon 218]